MLPYGASYVFVAVRGPLEKLGWHSEPLGCMLLRFDLNLLWKITLLVNHALLGEGCGQMLVNSEAVKTGVEKAVTMLQRNLVFAGCTDCLGVRILRN